MPSIPFPALTAELTALYRVSRAKKTAQRMTQALELARGIPGLKTTAHLTPAIVAAFAERAAIGRHKNTAATLTSYFRRACSYAAERRYLDVSPFTAWPDFVRMEPGESPSRVIAPKEIGRVLASLRAATDGPESARLSAVAHVLAYTGIRRDEALFLRTTDVDLSRRTLEVKRRLKRITARRTIPIAPDLVETLTRWATATPAGWMFPNSRGNPWSGGTQGQRPTDRLRQAGEREGIPGFTPGSLRHSFATHAATLWGVPPATLQGWMGHTDLRTTMKFYVHLEIAHLVAASRFVVYPAA